MKPRLLDRPDAPGIWLWTPPTKLPPGVKIWPGEIVVLGVTPEAVHCIGGDGLACHLRVLWGSWYGPTGLPLFTVEDATA